MKTAAEVMKLVTKGRRRGTLTQKQADWVLGVWASDEGQPEAMTTPGGWHGMRFLSDGEEGGWYVWYNLNRTLSFKGADLFAQRPVTD